MSYVQKRGLAQYGQMATTAEASVASPHRLVQMLMEGALEKIAIAKGHMMRRDFSEKSRYVSWAIAIINGLRSSLDLEAGGELAANLDNLYEYMGRRLFDANRHNNVAILDEVTSLMVEIKGAWDALPERVKAPNTAATKEFRPASA
ncbi:flagellar biosynthesis protein FliS [Gammaproteobacteria bacterium]